MNTIIDMIIADHSTIRALLARLMAKPIPPDATTLFATFYDLLSVHLRFEQDVVYPLVNRHSETAVVIGKAYDDHAEIHTLLEALNNKDEDDGTADATLAVLSVDLEHHFTDEEKEILPHLRKRIDRPQLASLGRDYLAAKDLALTDMDALSAKAWSRSW